MLTTEEITVVAQYATDGYPASDFAVEKKGKTYIASATVIYDVDNIRRNEFLFRMREKREKANPDDSFFGRGSRLMFIGSTSKPIYGARLESLTKELAVA